MPVGSADHRLSYRLTGEPQANDRERAGARVVLVMLLVLVVLLGGAYVAAYSAAQDKIPRGTTVADVDVGGRTLGPRPPR